MKKNWKEVNFDGKFTFSLPNNLTQANEQSIDSGVALWQDKDITVRVDYGLFSDPLTSYANRPNYRLFNDQIDGHAARVVRFDHEDGGHFVSVHFPNLARKGDTQPKKLTIVIETSQTVGSELPEKIIRSIRFEGET